MSNKTKNEKSGFVTLKEIFTNKRVLIAMLLTLFYVLFYHLGTMLTLPWVELPSYDLSATSGNTFISMLNLLSGGGLKQVSIFAIGVGPFITAQIIIQLLSSDLIPPLSRLAKSGERGKKKLEIITRLITLPFCIIQSYAIIAMIMNTGNVSMFGVNSLGALSAGQIITMITLMTSGTYIAIFIGDMISKRGVGNGITVIIMAGIVGSLFTNFNVAFQSIIGKIGNSSEISVLTSMLSCALYTLFFFLILLAVVFVNGSTRKIPIQQTGQGLTDDKEKLPFLPIKLNSAGVIPVIFASSIMTIPGTIAQFLPEDTAKWIIMDWFTLDSWTGILMYVVFIILFTFFYSYVQINPSQLAENFEKSGKFIPGVRSGTDTEKHISKVLSRVNWIGAPFLALIAALPYVLSIITGIPSGMALGGTGVIIMVTGSLELWNSIKSAATTTGYNVTKQQISSTYYEKDKDDDIKQLW